MTDDELVRHALYEPSAASRQAAADLYDWYVAMQQSGFTRDEAMEIIVKMIKSQ